MSEDEHEFTMMISEAFANQDDEFLSELFGWDEDEDEV